MAQKITNETTQRTTPAISFTVNGAPDDYRYVLRGADLVLIDRNNTEHIFLFVGNIMSLDGQVNVTFSNGSTLRSHDLFKRAEMVDVDTFYEEEIQWDARNEDPDDDSVGNTSDPDGEEVDSAMAKEEAQNVQALVTPNVKEQLMQALHKANENTSRHTSEALPNDNVSPEVNTNTTDKQLGADQKEPEPIPQLTAPAIYLTDETNSGDTNDTVTNILSPHIRGEAYPGAALTFLVDGTPVGTGTAPEKGEFEFIVPESYGDGTHTVQVQASKFGQLVESKIMPLVIDTTAPELPSIDLAPGSDTGESDSDRIVNDPRPILAGSYPNGNTSEAGATLTVEGRLSGTEDFLAIGTTTVQEDGTWTYQLPAGASLADGSYDFRLSAVDVAGNASVGNSSILSGVTIDTQAPLLNDTLNLTVDSDNDVMPGTDSDYITSDNQFALSGTANNDAIVRVYLDDTLVGETTPSGGSWSFDAGAFDFGSMSVAGNNAVLADGSYALKVVAFDQAGNQSAPVEQALVIDTAISEPVISIDGMVGSEDGLYYIGEVNPDFTISGEAYSSGTFSLVDTSTGLPVADDIAVRWDANTNSYSFASPATLAEGVYEASFTNIDAAGNTASTSIRFQVDAAPPPSPILSIEDTGSPQPGNPVTNRPDLIISFAPGANTENIHEVRVYLDGNNPPDLENDTYFQATRQGASWVLSPTFNLALRTALNEGYDGTQAQHSYTAVVIDRAGRTDKEDGEAYETSSFVYDTQPPSIQDVDLITDANNPDFDGLSDDYLVELDNPALTAQDRAVVDTVGDPIYVVPVNPTFGGSCEVGCDVTVILGDDINTDQNQTFRPATDSWSIRFGDTAQGETFALEKDAMNKVTISSKDQAGNVSQKVIYIKVAGDPPVAPSIDLVDAYNTGDVNDDITRGVDDDTVADQTDRDGLIQLHGNAPGAAYVVVSYVDDNGDTVTLQTPTGSTHIPVSESVWESPGVTLIDTATTTHQGTAYTFSVVAYDAANQPSSTSTYTVTLDRSTTTPTLELESDSSGPSGYNTLDYGAGVTGSTDHRTSLSVEGDVLTLSGVNAEDGATVWLVHTFNGVAQELNFAEFKDTVLMTGGETGAWSIDLDALDNRFLNFRQDGEHTFVVRATDPAGNVVDSAPLTVSFDSTAPTVGNEALTMNVNSSLDERFIIANPALDSLDDVYATDTLTRIPDFTLTGSLDAEVTDEADNVAVRVFRDSFQVGVANVVTDSQGNVSWEYNFSSGLADGLREDYTFHVEVTDRAGNTTVGNEITITVDRTPPTISNFELRDADDSFYDAGDPADDLGTDSDNYTNSPSLTLVGQSDVAAPVLLEYSLDGGTTYTALFAIPNGNQADGGVRPNGSSWNQDGAGNWTYTVSADDLINGLGTTATESVLFRATASDAAGNEVADSFAVSVDRLLPSGTTIDMVDTSDSRDILGGPLGEASIGTSDDNRTRNDVIELTGKAEAGTRVEIYRVDPGSDYSENSRGTLLDVVTADGQTGAWSLNHVFGGTDGDGEYDFAAVAVDRAGNRSQVAILSVHRDTVVETTPFMGINENSNTNDANGVGAGNAVDNPLVTAGTYRMNADGTTYLDKSSITIEGNLAGYDEAVDPVAAYVYESGNLMGKATITGTAWSFDVTTLVDDASYVYTLKVEDSAGNVTESAPLYVHIDSSTVAPTVDLIEADDTSGAYFYEDTTTPLAGTSDNVTNPNQGQSNQNNVNNAFTLEGDVAEAGSEVTLFVAHALDDGTYSPYQAVTGSVTQPSGAGTSWHCTVQDADLFAGDGNYRFMVEAKDQSGNTASKTIDIQVDSLAPSLLESQELWLDNDSGVMDCKTNADFLDLRGKLTDTTDRDIVLYIKQGTGAPIEVTDINWDTGEWHFDYTYQEHGSGGSQLPEGDYSFTLYAEDRAGNLTTYPPAGTYDIEIDRTLSAPSISLAPESNTFGGPARVDADGDGLPDGASDDYTGYVAANGTALRFDIQADVDSTVSVYLKDPNNNTPVNVNSLDDLGGAYELKGAISYDTTQNRWNPFIFDGSSYQNDTNEVTLLVLASDGSQVSYQSYTFTLDDENPVAVGNKIDWAPGNSSATHITNGTEVQNATNGKSVVLSGKIDGEGQADVTVEIFGATKSTLNGTFGARTSLGMASVDADGNWTFEAGSAVVPIVEAFHEFTARFEDRAGNMSEVTMSEVLVDRSAPATPGLAMVGTQNTDYTDGLTETNGDGYYVDDQGTFPPGDDIYYNDNNRVEFQLDNLETLPGSFLTVVIDNDSNSSTTIVPTGGTYTYTPPTLDDGTHFIEAFVTDAAGNVSETSTIHFVVDTQNPVIDNVVLDPASNTGSADDTADPVTKAEDPDIIGHSEAHAAITVEVRDDKGTADTSDDTVYEMETIANSDGNWSVTVEDIATGEYDVSVEAIDRAGNTSLETNVTSFEVNRDVDIVANSFQMVENAANDTGFLVDDRYTNNRAPSFSWQSNEDVVATFIFYKDGINTPYHTLEPKSSELSTSGNTTTWTPSSSTLNLGDGKYTVKAVFTDTEAGNETAPDDNTVDFIIDGTSTALSATLNTDSGIQDDWVTNLANIGSGDMSLQITAPSGTDPKTDVRVQVFRVGEDGNRTLLTPTNATNPYVELHDTEQINYDMAASSFPKGDNKLIIVSTDLAGNTTEIERIVTVDTEVDAGEVSLAQASNTGVYASDGDFIDNKTSDATPRLVGTTEANSTVDLYLGDPDSGGTLLAQNIPTDSNGNWYFDVDTDNRNDAGGQPLRQALANLTDTSGTGDRDGTGFTFYARVTDQAGNVADASGSIILDTSAPDEASSFGRILSSQALDSNGNVVYFDTGLDHTDNYTSATKPTLTGEVPEGNTKVDVYITYPDSNGNLIGVEPTFIGTTKADATGKWQLEFPPDATSLTGSPLGTDYEVRVKSYDNAGNESNFSPATTITIDTSVGDADGDLDDDLAGDQPAMIRFGAAFDAANPIANGADPVWYDPTDNTLKTNLTSPVFDVTLEPGCDSATLTLVKCDANGTPMTNPVVDQDIFTINLGPDYPDNPPLNGKWTGVVFKDATDHAVTINGNWRLLLSGTDKAGNHFELEGGQPLTVNGIPPEFDLEIVEDQADNAGHGLYAGDSIVNSADVHFRGTFGDEVDWQEISSVSIIRSVDNVEVTSLTSDQITGETWTMTASSMALGGANNFSVYVRALDNFGNDYWYPSKADPLTYTMDRNAPMLNEASVDLVAADDSVGIFRAVDTDDVTKERLPHISFGSEDNSKVELLMDGTVLFTAMPPDPTDSNGVYTYALGNDPLTEALPAKVTYDQNTKRYTYLSDSLDDGNYVFTLRATDLAGNVSIRDLTVTVDNVYLDEDLTVDLDRPSDNGMYGDSDVANNDDLTNLERPVLTGAAEENSAVRIYLQRFDTEAEAQADTNFVVGNDASWYTDTPHHEIVLDGQTTWSWAAENTDHSELADGYYKAIVVSEDQAGNRPTPKVYIFGKDTDNPSEPGDAHPLDFHLWDTLEGDGSLKNEGASNDGEVVHSDIVDADGNPIWLTSNWMPTIGGTAEPGSRLSITLRIDGDLDGNLDDPTAIYKQLTIDVPDADTNPSGEWSFDFAGQETGAGRLADGIYTAEVVCTDKAGNSTTINPSPQFQIKSIPPSPPTIRLDPEDDSYDSQTNSDGITDHNTALTLRGTAEAGAVVRLYSSEIKADTNDLITPDYLANHLITTITANASGEWVYEVPEDSGAGDPDPTVVEDGEYRYFVASKYFNGNTYYSLQDVDDEGHARINADGSPILRQPVTIVENGQTTVTYPDYVLEVDTKFDAEPTFELGLTLDTSAAHTEDNKYLSSRMDSGINNDWRTPEEVAAGVYLGEFEDFWGDPGQGTYNDWVVKTSGPTVEGTVEAGSIVEVQRFVAGNWTTVGTVNETSTVDGSWRFVFPAEYENAEYLVRIKAIDKAGNIYTSPEKTIVIDAEIKDTVLDLPDAQDTQLLWTGVDPTSSWDNIADTATLVGLDYVQKAHLPAGFESGYTDDLTTNNNLSLYGEVEEGSRFYLTDTRQGVTVKISPVLVADPATMLNDATATEAYYVRTDNTADPVGTWAWQSQADFQSNYGADYSGIYFHITNDGSWEYHTGPLEDVKHAYAIENIDLAGNRAVTTPLALTIDNEFTDANILLSSGSDHGPFGSDDAYWDDGITNDSTPQFRLYGDTGATYLVYAFKVNADGTLGDNVNADGSPMASGIYSEGEDTYVEFPLVDGGYQIRLVNVSESGHVSEAIYPPTEADNTYVVADDWEKRDSVHPLVIDTVAPVIPDQAALETNPDYYVHMQADPNDPTAPWDDPVTVDGHVLPIIISGDATDVDGTGIISADLITRDSKPEIQVFVEPGSMIQVSGMGYSNTPLTDHDNDGVITLNPSEAHNNGNPYANGTYSMDIRFGDIAGNLPDEAAHMQFDVQIDWGQPGATIVLATGDDHGTAPRDNVTNETSPTLTGYVTADTVRYSVTVGSTVIERHIGDGDFGTLNDDGTRYTWEYTPTLGNGEYAVSITAWDRAGNVGGNTLAAFNPDDPNISIDNVPLIIHDTGELPLYASCESNRTGSRIYLDIDYSVSDAYNDEDNAYAGANKLFFTYHYTDGSESSEVVEMALGETDFSNSLRFSDGYSSIEFYMEDSAGNQSATGTVDIANGPDGDGIYSVTGVTGDLADVPEIVGAEFSLSGQLSDDNLTDNLEVSDVSEIRATINGDIDGDGSEESLTTRVSVAEDGSWTMNFTQALAADDYTLDLTALSTDGSSVNLASATDLSYEFRVLTEEMQANENAASQVLFDSAEVTQAAPAAAPDPGDTNTITVEVPNVVIEETIL